jgi:hypothetical protein
VIGQLRNDAHAPATTPGPVHLPAGPAVVRQARTGNVLSN